MIRIVYNSLIPLLFLWFGLSFPPSLFPLKIGHGERSSVVEGCKKTTLLSLNKPQCASIYLPTTPHLPSLLLSFLHGFSITHPTLQCFLYPHHSPQSPLFPSSSLVPLCSLLLPNTFLPSNPASHNSYSFFALLLPSIPLCVSGSSLRTFPDVTVQYCPRGQQHKTCSVAHTHARTHMQCTPSVSMGS